MDKTKYKAIGGSLIGLAMIALLLIYGPGLTENTYYCEDENKLLEAEFGISGGRGTRLYLTKEQDSWDYCSTGWLKATDYVEIDENATIEPTIDSITGEVTTSEGRLCRVINQNAFIKECIVEETNETYIYIIN